MFYEHVIFWQHEVRWDRGQSGYPLVVYQCCIHGRGVQAVSSLCSEMEWEERSGELAGAPWRSKDGGAPEGGKHIMLNLFYENQKYISIFFSSLSTDMMHGIEILPCWRHGLVYPVDVTDEVTTKGARASADMVLTWIFQNILISTPKSEVHCDYLPLWQRCVVWRGRRGTAWAGQWPEGMRQEGYPQRGSGDSGGTGSCCSRAAPTYPAERIS